MKLVLLSLCLVLLTGCALLDKYAPPQVDSQGNVIPGTNTATPLINNVAGAIPYGSEALNIILLITNFVALVKKNKVAKGFKATVQAIEQASKDPLVKGAIDKIKEKLSDAHDLTDTQPVVKAILDKI